MLEQIIHVIKSWEIDFKNILAKVILGLAVFFIFFIAGKIIKNILLKLNSKIAVNYPTIRNIIPLCIYYFFIFVGAYLFLQIVGLQAYFVKILAGAGIVGIIAGFALKDIASNAFSGLLLFLERPYLKDDWIQVDGHFGKVNNIGFLTTSIINKTGQQVYIANQLIYSGTFINYSKFNLRGIKIQTDVVQYFDLDNLKKIVSNQIQNIPSYVPNKKVDFFIHSISSDGNYSLAVFFWVYFKDESDFLNTISHTVFSIRSVCADNKIDIVNTKWISDEDNTTNSGDY